MLNKMYFTAEFKAIKEDGQRGIIEGYGSAFDVIDTYGEICLRGCFQESLQKRMPAMLWQHSADKPIGVWTEAVEDDRGLFLRGEINLEVTTGREAYALLKQGALKGLSIGFRYGDTEEGMDGMRRLKSVDLHEVSIVTFPANAQATVMQVRGDMTPRELERILRSCGFSQKQAKAIVARGYNGLAHRDDEGGDQVTDEQRDVAVLSQIETLIKTFRGGSYERNHKSCGGSE